MLINIVRYILNFFDNFQQKKIIFFLKKNLPNKISVFDVGSHHGEFALMMSKNFNIEKMHCFEPSKINFKTLNKNIQKENFFLNNVGLGEVKEKKKINQISESSSSTLNKIKENSKYLKKKMKILNKKYFKDYISFHNIEIEKGEDYFLKNKIGTLDLLKIDTEGYELYVIRGFASQIKKIKYIYFEHHYDDMIIKNYSFSDMHNYLLKNDFVKVYKSKMFFRKTFEYIYKNNSNIL
jgi:FkbM family methyltransferase